MGGFRIVSEEFSDGIPVNSEQLLYLVQHKLLEMPTMTERRIKEMSSYDFFSKYVSASY